MSAVLNLSNCQWRTVVDKNDYSVIWGQSIIIVNRCGEYIKLTAQQAAAYSRYCGNHRLYFSDENLVNFCINQGIIPHPVDELITVK